MVSKWLLPTLLAGILTGCQALPSFVPDIAYTPIDAQVGKDNTQQTVGKQENVQGDKQSNVLNSSTSMVAGVLAGSVITMGTSLPFMYLLLRRRKKQES